MSLRSIFGTLFAAALIVLPMATLPVAQAQIGIGVSINIAPPVLPIYEQPPLPAPGFLWTPGYWAYGDAGYFWVPGVWVRPPHVGLLWTPGYWGWGGASTHGTPVIGARMSDSTAESTKDSAMAASASFGGG